MKTGVKFALALFAPLFFSTLACCADPAPATAPSDSVFEEGLALMEKSCNSCHNGDLFSPEMRKVNSLEKLREMVDKCSKAAGANWAEKEKAAVVHFLNVKYYKF